MKLADYGNSVLDPQSGYVEELLQLTKYKLLENTSVEGALDGCEDNIMVSNHKNNFKRLLGEFGLQELRQNKQHSFKMELGKLWPKLKQDENRDIYPTKTPSLHCELHITAYLNLIGISKLMCWACNAYVEEVNNHRHVVAVQTAAQDLQIWQQGPAICLCFIEITTFTVSQGGPRILRMTQGW
ncbi:hypothetical protein BYT27DRAFT_7218001 [Phlegmacium glaucopus]|nr:hypothetical protein BYT27DRAFT_7218001 [Phlegmacium glaucopus]